MWGCSTLADSGGGGDNLPNALAGPFRDVTQAELGSGVAPYAVRDEDRFARDASLVDLDGDPATLEVAAYVARRQPAEGEDPDPLAPTNQILRHGALDGRSFDRTPAVVLEPALAWEGGVVAQPSAIRVDGQVWLYYAAAGGIGLARSDAPLSEGGGFAFERVGDGPVLADYQGRHASSPGVIRLPDGSLRMFFSYTDAAGCDRLGEARSADGVAWQPLAPHFGCGQAGSVHAGGARAPFAVLARTPLGRDVTWLYFGATDADGKGTIALAARYGFDGPLSLAESPVFGSATSLGPTEPCVLRYPGFTLLFATELAGTTSALAFPAVAVGVAPATITLPPTVPP